jgi:hypothetical protein
MHNQQAKKSFRGTASEAVDWDFLLTVSDYESTFPTPSGRDSCRFAPELGMLRISNEATGAGAPVPLAPLVTHAASHATPLQLPSPLPLALPLTAATPLLPSAAAHAPQAVAGGLLPTPPSWVAKVAPVKKGKKISKPPPSVILPSKATPLASPPKTKPSPASTTPTLAASPSRAAVLIDPECDYCGLENLASAVTCRRCSAALLPCGAKRFYSHPPCEPPTKPSPTEQPCATSTTLSTPIVCAHCTYGNDGDAEICLACSHSLVATPAPHPAPLRLATLSCPMCTTPNVWDALACSTCSHSLAPVARLATLSCPMCMFDNERDASRCQLCDHPLA